MEERLAALKMMLETQGQSGNWDYDPYMHGMFNGMELVLSVLENRELKVREAPEKWLCELGAAAPKGMTD